MGVTFPELEALRQAATKHDEEMDRRGEADRRGPAAQPQAHAPSLDHLVAPHPQSPIVGGKKAGRNDPCPCGSGKKYKKCCMGKP